MSRKPFRVTIYIDGGARGNPGPAAAGVVITDSKKTVLHESGIFLGKATNNVAEYKALLAGMQAARKLGADEVEVFSDAQLLVRQMTGEYRVKNERLQLLHEEALNLQGHFARCSYRHIPREENKHADKLANLAINLRRNVDGLP
ncbi:MAG TPA: ribonuclease HI family protein [Phycisphaerae bacterium]|nr:ribonuclease HI family protein [Phycisphaerae bacterium]